MIRLVVLLFLMFCLVQPVYGDTVEFEWSYTQAEEAHIDGYIIYERTSYGKVEALPDIDPSARTGVVDMLGDTSECRTYYIVAMKDDVSSGASNTAAICPETTLPPMVDRPDTPGGFKAIELPQ